MKRTYKIAKTGLGYIVYRKKEENGMMQLWFLCHDDVWKLNKDSARIFYHEEDAVSALVIQKSKHEGEKSD